MSLLSLSTTALLFFRRRLRGEHEDAAVVPEVPLRPLPRGGDEERRRHARRREATALQEEHPQETARRTGTHEKVSIEEKMFFSENKGFGWNDLYRDQLKGTYVVW